MGMTDLQFKAHIRLLIRSIEYAEAQKDAPSIRRELSKLKKDLQTILETSGERGNTET